MASRLGCSPDQIGRTLWSNRGTPMRKLATLAIASFATMTASTLAASDVWTTFVDPTKNISVEVPHAPTISSDTSTTPNGSKFLTTQYVVDGGAAAYIVTDTMLDRKSDVTDAAIVEGSVQGLAAKNTLITNEPDKLGAHLGRYIALSDAGGDQIADRIFVVGAHLFQALTVIPKAATAEQNSSALRFRRSFRLLK
jgi:hypothetical protein